MNEVRDRPLTPWVGRLLAINAIVLLLQQTVLTSPQLADLVTFDPATALLRPWTFITYMFVHANLLHLLFNSLALFVVGPTVERRFGSPRFLAYYLYCGIGAAAFSLLVSKGVFVGSFVGASGAILGLAFAFARFAPDAEMMVFPIPVPIKAKRLVWLLIAFDVVGAFFLNDNIAHVAHLGGLGSGWLYFMLQGIAHPVDPPRLPAMAPRVPVGARSGDAVGRQRVVTPRRDPLPAAPAQPENHVPEEAVEIDRVLDKISAGGIESLTPEERRFLDAVARRRRDRSHKSAVLLDLVSPWATAVESSDAGRQSAAFRSRHADLLEALRRQRAPLHESLALAPRGATLRALVLRASNPEHQQRLRATIAAAAQLGADVSVTAILLAGDGSGSAAEALPYPGCAGRALPRSRRQ